MTRIAAKSCLMFLDPGVKLDAKFGQSCGIFVPVRARN
jgi:hypothetical protein